MTLLSKSSKGSSSPPTYSKLSSNGLTELGNNGVYSAMNGSSVGLTEQSYQNSGRNHNHNSHTGMTLNPFAQSKPSLGSNQNKVKNYHLIKTSDALHNTTPIILKRTSQSNKLPLNLFLRFI